jgi:TetR/AcrR family transcriptional regulator
MSADAVVETVEADSRASGTMYRHIARAAARLFASQGYDATSVREIVAAAGVTKPTLYYHFGSKAGLANALLNAPLSRLTADLRAVLETEPDPGEALRKMIGLQFEFCLDDPDRMRFIHALFFGPWGSHLMAEIAPYCEEFDRVFLAVSRRLAEAGIIAEGFEDEFTTHIRGLVVVSTLDFLFQNVPLDPDRVSGMVQHLIHGFADPARSGITPAQGSKTR